MGRRRKGWFLCRGMFSPVLQVTKSGRERLMHSYKTVSSLEFESLLEAETDCSAVKKVADSK